MHGTLKKGDSEKKNMLYHEGKSKVNNFLLGDLIIGNVLAIMGLTLLERMLQKIH